MDQHQHQHQSSSTSSIAVLRFSGVSGKSLKCLYPIQHGRFDVRMTTRDEHDTNGVRFLLGLPRRHVKNNNNYSAGISKTWLEKNRRAECTGSLIFFFSKSQINVCVIRVSMLFTNPLKIKCHFVVNLKMIKTHRGNYYCY